MYRNEEAVNVMIFQCDHRQVGEVIAPRDAWLPIPAVGQTIHLAESGEPATAWKVTVPTAHHAYLGGNIVVTVNVKPIPYDPIILLVNDSAPGSTDVGAEIEPAP